MSQGRFGRRRSLRGPLAGLCSRIERAASVRRRVRGQQVISTYRRAPRRTVSRSAGALIAVALGAGAALAAQYEKPPTFTARAVLPPGLLNSPYYKVQNQVGVENYQYVFDVDTQWGTYRIVGTTLLKVRAREMQAATKLAEVGGAETLVDAAGATALKPLGTAKGLVTAPGKTIGDTFKGVGNFFGGLKAGMEATDPRKEGIVASVTGGAAARRKLAFDLGVDPYTSFKPLDEQLTRLATASAVGNTGVNVGLSFVTGGASIAISATSTSQKLREALRDKTAAQLEQQGREFLTVMGVSKAAQDAFYANANLTPTDKAVIVVALKTLGNVAGRQIYIETAATASSIEMAFYYRRQSELIANYNKKVAPVTGFIRAGRAPMVADGEGHGVDPAGRLSLLERADRGLGIQRAGPDVAHGHREPDRDVAAFRARLESDAQGRRAVGLVIFVSGAAKARAGFATFDAQSGAKAFPSFMKRHGFARRRADGSSESGRHGAGARFERGRHEPFECLRRRLRP